MLTLSSRHVSCSGFTLAELLVTIVVAGLLLSAMSGFVGAGVENAAMDREAARVRGAIEKLRMTSILAGQQIPIESALTELRSPDGVVYTLGSDVVFAHTVPLQTRLFPDGTATPTTFTLTRGDARRDYRIRWLDARVVEDLP